MIDNRGGAVGLALNLNPSWINFYLATDIVTAKHTPQFIPIKQSIMNVTLGIGVPIGRRVSRPMCTTRIGGKRTNGKTRPEKAGFFLSGCPKILPNRA